MRDTGVEPAVAAAVLTGAVVDGDGVNIVVQLKAIEGSNLLFGAAAVDALAQDPSHHQPQVCQTACRVCTAVFPDAQRHTAAYDSDLSRHAQKSEAESRAPEAPAHKHRMQPCCC